MNIYSKNNIFIYWSDFNQILLKQNVVSKSYHLKLTLSHHGDSKLRAPLKHHGAMVPSHLRGAFFGPPLCREAPVSWTSNHEKVPVLDHEHIRA